MNIGKSKENDLLPLVQILGTHKFGITAMLMTLMGAVEICDRLENQSFG